LQILEKAENAWSYMTYSYVTKKVL
jgi:hypothetical protein